MTPPTSARAIGRFGPYELDVRSGEIRKFGIRVKLGEQPLRILILLTECPGEMVTREELRARLWSHDTFVDFDHSLNSAIQRLRETLSDTAENARWIETVPRRGYRFVGAVEWSSPNGCALAEVSTFSSTDEAVEHPLPELPAPSAQRSRFFGWRWFAAVVVFLLAAAAIIKIVQRNRALAPTAPIRSLAVLPLENLSGDPSQGYFADGMTDELITALAKNRALRVISRTSTMQYKGAQRPLRDIARELGVDGILEGSVERSANRVHMTVQLIYAPTDSHVWAESYDRDLNQAYSLPSELSETIAKEVKTATSAAPRQRYINPEAHDAYLRGRYFWFSFNIPQALQYFEKAIQLQPDYAAAWSGLADAYAQAGMGDRPPLQVMPKALEAARRAVDLDDSLPEAHNCMAAWYLFYGWDLPRADAESKRAIELNPNYAEAHQLHAFTLSAMNREAEGLAEEKRAVELDPFARPFVLGMFYTDIRQYDAAISELRLQRLARPNDDDVVMNLSKAYWMKGMYKESQEELEEGMRLEGKPEAAAAAHQAWIRGGERAVEQWGADRIKARARQGYVYAYWMASTIAFTGDREQTLKYLEQAYREHAPDMITVQNEPLFDFLHSDPRYHALLKKIGLQFVP